MEWIEATVQTCPEGTELLCAALTEAGFDSFQTEDCAEFETFLQTSQEYWDYVDEALTQRMQGRSVVRLWLASETAQRELERLRGLLAALPARFPGAKLGALTLSLETVPDADWETDWQNNYRPLPVGEKLLIVPSWMSVGQTDGRLPILLNLGMTFGTGEHPSTQMCLSELERHIRGGERVADLGSGSGILSIAALRLGAGTATGIDVDPAAEHISAENAALNGFGPERFTACTGNVVQDHALMRRLSEGSYDIVCANIVAGVLIELAPVVPHFLREDAVFICSGILDTREQEVRCALERAGLTVTGRRAMEQWRCLTAKRS